MQWPIKVNSLEFVIASIMNTKLKLMLRIIAFVAFLLSFTQLSFSQGGFTVNGRVADKNGLPVEGVSVQEKGTQNIVVSQKDGSFSIRTSSGGATLVFSS